MVPFKVWYELIGLNMKIVEEYAQRVADEKVKKDRAETIVNMFSKGFSIEEIVWGTNYKLSFVEEVLSKYSS